MEFLSVRATAERWGVSVRNVQRLLKEDRIHGAYKCSGCWMIPVDAPKPDDPTRFCACMVSLLSAIHLNDSGLYARVSHYLQQEMRSGDENTAHVAEVALTGPSLSMKDMSWVSMWVQKGDFSRLLPEARPMGMYLSLKNLQGQKRYGELLCACKAAIALWEREDTFTLLDIYLRMLCATGCYEMNRVEECDRHLLAAMELALPNGFITPFVEFWMNTGCQIEHLLEQRYPQWRDPVERVSAATWKNWIAFHNRYTRENITTLLTQREYRMAQIIVAGGTYQNVADELYLSLSTVKSMLSAIYDKLLIHSRAELAEMIM